MTIEELEHNVEKALTSEEPDPALAIELIVGYLRDMAERRENSNFTDILKQPGLRG